MSDPMAGAAYQELFTAIHHHITNFSSLGITTALFDKNMLLTLQKLFDQYLYVSFFVIPWQRTGIQLVNHTSITQCKY
jgi:hypothetical protein